MTLFDQNKHVHSLIVGWSFECLKKWGKFTKVTTYSISLTLVWWLCTEIGVFLGGLLSTEELGAFSISCQVLSLSWMVRLIFIFFFFPFVPSLIGFRSTGMRVLFIHHDCHFRSRMALALLLPRGSDSSWVPISRSVPKLPPEWP